MFGRCEKDRKFGDEATFIIIVYSYDFLVFFTRPNNCFAVITNVNVYN